MATENRDAKVKECLYEDEDYKSSIVDNMNSMRKELYLCDVTLISDNVEVPAHKMVLATSSPYFYAMFKNFEETKKDKVTLQEISSRILILLVDYIYSGRILISEENVQELLIAANFLQLTDLCEECAYFLENSLGATNCLGIRSFAKIYNCENLVNKANNYIQAYMQEVVKCEEFLLLSYEEVLNLFSTDEIGLPSEEKVFEAVIFWVKHDLPFRRKYLPSLLEQLRLSSLSSTYLTGTVLTEPLLHNDPKCQGFVKEAKEYDVKKGDKTRQFRDWSKILFVAGGCDNITSIEYYDFVEETWFNLSDMPTERRYGAIAVMDGKIYIAGGENYEYELTLKNVDIYDTAADKWVHETRYIWDMDVVISSVNMMAKRYGLGLGVLNNRLYAVGGRRKRTIWNTVEIFDSYTQKWCLLDSTMTTNRCFLGVGVVDNLLYAVGGYDGVNELSSVECYNPEVDRWISVSNMRSARCHVGAAVLNNLLYAISSNTMEAFDPRTGTWTPLTDTNYQQKDASIAVGNNYIYAVGGLEDKDTLVEVYDPRMNKWTALPTAMNKGRSQPYVAMVNRPVQNGN